MRRLSSASRSHKYFIYSTLTVLSMSAALLVPATAASAGTTPTPAKTVSSTKSGATTSAGSSAVSEAKAAAAAKAAANTPIERPKAGTAATLRPNPKAGHPSSASSSSAGHTVTAPSATAQARSAAAKTAIAHSTVADTCSGAIEPDVVYPCTSPSASGTDTFTINLTSSTDVVFFEVDATASSGASVVSLTAPGSTTATTCSSSLMSSVGQCATSGAGTYTVTVASNEIDYTIAYTPLLSDTNCTAADLSFAATVAQTTVAAGETGDCFTLGSLTAGDTFEYAYQSSVGYQTSMVVYDSTGTQVCTTSDGACTLTGTGPYRVFFSAYNPSGYTYSLQLTSLTDPAGCLAVAQQTYGTVPDASSTDDCRSIAVATAGEYQVFATNAGSIATTLYNPDGSTACTNTGSFCQLAAGDYNFVEDPGIVTTPAQFGLVFIAASETTGCTSTGDTDFASGPATGTFTGAGEEFCLTLPTASGNSVFLFNVTSQEQPSAVLDATGAQQCFDFYQNNDVCALTGTAPFHVIMGSEGAGSTFSLLVQRTDSSAGCTAWPQSGFGGNWGATVKTAAGQNDYDCLSIPADQHSTGEMIDYADTTNSEDGGIAVYGPTGTQACLILTTGGCSYQAGVAYDAILSNSGQTQTYDLVRRDISSTATCAAPASTAPGGASTATDLTSDLDTQCYRITAAAADDVFFSATASSVGNATVTLQVADPTGTIVCREWGVTPCQLSGSASYQALVTATGYAGVTIASQLDSWIVSTASGWASQCTANALSTNGWAAVNGSFTQSAAGYCAVISYQPNQSFSVLGVMDNGTQTPWTGIYSTADWGQSPGLGLCNSTTAGLCQTNGLTSAGQAVLLVTPKNTPYPAQYSIQGVCDSGCSDPIGTETVTSISPATQQAGPANKIVLTGTNLTLGLSIEFETPSTLGQGTYAAVAAVNSTNTQLTVVLNSTAMTPGSYGVYDGYQALLANAYTVTAAPTSPNSGYVTTTPSRILSTKAAADSTQVVKATGVDGVPTSGANAVALDLTVDAPAEPGSLVAYADGASRPSTSTLSFDKGVNATGLAVVPVTDGKIDVYSTSGGTVSLGADLVGYYTTTSGAGAELTAVTPTAIATNHVLAADSTAVMSANTGSATAASAAVVNVTVTAPTATGSLIAFAEGASRPGVTSVSFNAKAAASTAVVVGLKSGEFDIYNDSSSPVTLTVSLEGYYTTTGSGFQNLGGRILDTRSGLGGSGEAVSAGGAAVLSAEGSTGIPYTATAVLLNVSVVGAQDAGELTVLADGDPIPAVDNVQFTPGQTTNDLVLVPLASGSIDFYNSSAGTVQVFADVEGYYTS
jgi:hypothetical protein